jgi:flagellin
MSQVAEARWATCRAWSHRELAVQSARQSLGATERGFAPPSSASSQRINRISAVTEFNGQKLVDGSASTGLTFQVGKENTANDRLSMSITKLNSSTLGSTLKVGSATLSTVTGARAAIGVFDKAIEQLSTARAKVGAVQNRMVVTISSLSVAQENLAAANSRIRDVDAYGLGSSTLTKSQILSQAGLAVLAQANQLPNSALSAPALIGSTPLTW